MKTLLLRIQILWRQRTERERWLLGGAGTLLVAAIFQLSVIGPLQDWVTRTEGEVAQLQTDLVRATRLAGDVRRLQGELTRVEERIRVAEETNLFNLLEGLAASTKVKNQLESIKPKKPSGNALFPETRVEVSLKGVTLTQMVDFLYQIENTDRHLIIRSVRIRRPARVGRLAKTAPPRLDVSFSVSSFERARAAG